MLDTWNIDSMETPDGAEKPNDAAKHSANTVLQKVAELCSKHPISVWPSIDEGVLIRYSKEDINVFIECYNDQAVGVSITVDKHYVDSGDWTTLDLFLAEGLNKIVDFLND